MPKQKLSPEERSAIAKEAARRRWSKKNVPLKDVESLPDPKIITGATVLVGGHATVDVESVSNEKHCPACLAGESLEEGEGTHILATVEHPVRLPAEFADAETSVAVVEPSKPKQKSRAIPKEFKGASSYAEKRLLQANKERAAHAGEIAKHQAKIKELDAEINGLLPIIQALTGQAPVAQSGTYQVNGQPSQTHVPQLPPLYPEYQQPAAQLPVVTPPKPMRAGGAGVAQGMLEVPNHWYEG